MSASLSYAFLSSLRRIFGVTRKRPYGRVDDPKFPQALRAPAAGQRCHAGAGAMIVPWRQPGDWALNYLIASTALSRPDPDTALVTAIQVTGANSEPGDCCGGGGRGSGYHHPITRPSRSNNQPFSTEGSGATSSERRWLHKMIVLLGKPVRGKRPQTFRGSGQAT